MDSASRKILILGDELGQGEATAEAFRAAGFDVVHFTRPQDASAELERRQCSYALVDCMLPGSENGVEFIMHCKQNINVLNVKFVLMSGLFTEKSFIKEALARTKAIKFVEKRSDFDPSILVQVVKDNLASSEVPARKKLYQIFSKEAVTKREKRRLIESLDEVSGFDLPFIYSLLVETKSSGYLNIYEKSGAVSGISFSNGCIVRVDAEDKTTVLGEMLIQSGYATPQNVQAALAEKSNVRMGTRMVNANFLSPHAVDMLLLEQMNIRLSRTVKDTMVKLNFATNEVELTSPSIDSEALQVYLHDWIASKIDPQWLKSLYLMWSGNPLILSPTFKDDHPALFTGLVQALPDLIARIKEGKTTLTQLLEARKFPETAVYKGLHFLLTKGLVTFGEKQSSMSVAEQQVALKKLWNDMQGKNPYEIVDMVGAENLKDEGLSLLLGPKPADANSNLGILWNGLHKKIMDAVSFANDVNGRTKFKEDTAIKQAENKIKARKKLEEARQKLGLYQYGPALQLLKEAQHQCPEIEGLHLLCAWAKTGIVPADKEKKEALLKEIEFELLQVSAEERYEASYPLVTGLYLKAKGDLGGAKKNFEKAIAMNSSLIQARRELSQLHALVKKNSVDLKGLVSGFFKRK